MIAVDIEMPAEGAPTIACPRGVLPFPPVFVLAIPPSGGEEEARLFAVCVDRRTERVGRSGVFQTGARPDALPYEGHVLAPVDPDVVPRLFERGHHPGDFQVEGVPSRGAKGPAVAVLSILDLSEGMLSGFDRLSLPAENRFALAEAFAPLGGAWSRAADLLDPASLVRSGAVAPLGGNPLTAEAHHRHMLELNEAGNAALDAERHPMMDYRSLSRAELAYEIHMDGRAAASARADLARDGRGAELLRSGLSAVSVAFAAGTCSSEDIRAVLALRDLAVQDGEYAILMLAEGRGAGAACWRNLFAEDGLLATAERRLASPGCDDGIADAVAALPPWASKAFRNPDEVVRNRLAKLDRLPRLFHDVHRPYFAMHQRRISASPGLAAAVGALDGERLRVLIEGNRMLTSTFDAIPSRHPEVSAARDALALGWRVLAREHLHRWPDITSIRRDDPGLPESSAALPYVDRFDLDASPSRRFAPIGRAI